MSENTSPRRLLDICREIQETWVNKDGITQIRGDGPGYGAEPYFKAMVELGRAGLESPEDNYYNDKARDVVIYFLSNATSFRGDVARRIKAELKAKYGIK